MNEFFTTGNTLSLIGIGLTILGFLTAGGAYFFIRYRRNSKIIYKNNRDVNKLEGDKIINSENVHIEKRTRDTFVGNQSVQINNYGSKGDSDED